MSSLIKAPVKEMNLKGKTVLLTGASKGLGRALATGLDAYGCRLLLVARSADKLDSLLNDLRTPGSCSFPCDLSDPDARDQLIETIISSEPHLDLLILNAGIGSHSRLDQLTTAEVREVLQLNTLAPLELTAGLQHLLCSEQALPRDEPSGIVFIGSLAGDLAIPGMSLYSASKAALHTFSRAVDIESAAHDCFSLLVILGAIRGTNFGDSIRNPRSGPRLRGDWYRRLDMNVDQAASRIIRAIQQQKSQLVIPGWYGGLLQLSRLLTPLTRAVARFSYRKFQ
jgi:short-subunit dehydrogenase